MREETRARLETLMTRYERRLAEERKRHESTRKRQDAFIAEFEQLIEETIRPTMEDVGAALRRRGHDYEIATTQAYTDVDRRPRNTQVTMHVFPAGIPRSLFTSTSTPTSRLSATGSRRGSPCGRAWRRPGAPRSSRRPWRGPAGGRSISRGR